MVELSFTVPSSQGGSDIGCPTLKIVETIFRDVLTSAGGLEPGIDAGGLPAQTAGCEDSRIEPPSAGHGFAPTGHFAAR